MLVINTVCSTTHLKQITNFTLDVLWELQNGGAFMYNQCIVGISHDPLVPIWCVSADWFSVDLFPSSSWTKMASSEKKYYLLSHFNCLINCWQSSLLMLLKCTYFNLSCIWQFVRFIIIINATLQNIYYVLFLKFWWFSCFRVAVV